MDFVFGTIVYLDDHVLYLRPAITDATGFSTKKIHSTLLMQRVSKVFSS